MHQRVNMNLRENIKRELGLLFEQPDDKPDNWRELPGYNSDYFYDEDSLFNDEDEEDEEGPRLPEQFYDPNYDLDEIDLDEVFDETQKGDRVRYFVDVYYDAMLPSSGDPEKDKILAEKMARADMMNLKNREYIIGPTELRGYYR